MGLGCYRKQFGVMDKQEAKFSVFVNCWNKVHCNGQLLCSTLVMKKLLHDYGISRDIMCIFCDNTSAINLSKNPVQHLKSKHIEIRYHFIRDLVEEKIVWLNFINTDNQKEDIFTKPLDGPWFESLRKTIGVGIIPWLIFCVIYCCLLVHYCI